jgi:redox-sensitive bicupin YhaK (pirin superfamily)
MRILTVVSGEVNVGGSILSAEDAAKITDEGSVDLTAGQDSELAMVVVRV